MGLLDGKVVLVTAGDVVSRATALACAREGARIAVDARGPDNTVGDAIVAAVGQAGAEALRTSHGFAEASGAERSIGEVLDRWGQLDAVIVELRSAPHPRLDGLDGAGWRAAVLDPLDEAFHLAASAVPALSRVGGALVWVTGGEGVLGPGALGPSVVGHAMVGLVSGLARDHEHVRLHGVALASGTDADAAAGLLAYLASGGHDLSGEVFGVDGRALKAFTLRGSQGIVKAGDGPWSSADIAPRLVELRAPDHGPLPLGAGPEPTGSRLDDDTQVAPASARVWPIGKRYDGGYWLVDGQEIAAFAEAVDDPNAAYRGPGAVAPPMYHVRPFATLLADLAADPELELDGRLDLEEHVMRFRRPLRHGEVVQLRGTLEAVQQRGDGRSATFGLYGMVDGELALEGTTTWGMASTVASPAPASVDGPPAWTVEVRLPDDQAVRFAEASGDARPWHLDDASAVAVGLSGTVVHGTCLLAIAQREVVGRVADGDPGRLVQLAARFGPAVPPGARLRLDGWVEGGGRVAFEARRVDDSGEVTVLRGRAEVLP